jgi:hypothetical protein
MPSYAKWPHSGLDKFDDGPIKLGDVPLPAGCDQQGRCETREAAHAATEYTEPDYLAGDGAERSIGFALVAVCAIAVLGLAGLVFWH